MGVDLYEDWLGVPAGKRPPNHFALLGLSPDEENAQVIEQAARQQAQKVRERMTPAEADAAKSLMQEITRARAVLLDSAKRSAYKAALKSGSGGADPWWKQEVMPAKRPTTNVPPPRPSTTPASAPAAEFAEIDGGIRRRRKSSNTPLLLLALGGGGVLLAVAGAIAAILVLGSGTPATSEQAKHTPTSNNVAPPPSSRHEPTSPRIESEPTAPIIAQRPTTSTFAARPEPSANEAPKPNAPKSFKFHSGLVQGLAISPHGHRLLSAGDGGVIEWQIGADAHFVRYGSTIPAACTAYLSDGRHLLAANEGAITVIELLTNEIKKTLKYPRGNLLSLAADPDGKHFVTGGSDGSIRWWDISSEKPALTIELGDNLTVVGVAVSPDRRFIAAGASDGSVGLWELNGGKKVWREKHHKDGVTAIAFSADGSRVASAGLDGAVTMWTVDGGKALDLPGKHDGGALCVAFLKGAPLLVSGGRDKTLKFWNYESIHLMRTLPTPQPVHALAVPDHGGYVVYAGNGGMVELVPIPALDVEEITKEEPPEKKLAVPDASELDAARMAVREKYKAELAAEKPEEREFIAARLLERAGGKADPPQRLALFREAIDGFVKLGKPAGALSAVAAMARWFQVDELMESIKALDALTKTADATGQKEIVEAGLKLLPKVDEKWANLAAPLMEVVSRAAEKSGSPEVIKRVAAVTIERERVAKAKGRMAELEAKLKSDPNDAAANLEYGLLLGDEGRWSDALAHLAKGKDDGVAQLAKRDLAEPKEAKAKAELGYAWHEAAARLRNGRAALLARSAHWLEEAQAGLAGDEKSKLTLKLGQILAELADARPTRPKEMLPGGGGSNPATKPPPAAAKAGDVLRRNFYNSFNGESVFKSMWTSSGKTRWEANGLRVQDGGGGIESKFMLLENWHVEVIWDYDTRPGTLEVNGQTIAMPPSGPKPTRIIIERAGKKLTYQRALTSTRMGAATILELSGDNLAPSRVKLSFDGAIRSNFDVEGTLIRTVIIDGRTRNADEPEKKDDK
jgi:hypothetical protein